jgi:uncharacterized repeat protein (TIGR01451 family)
MRRLARLRVVLAVAMALGACGLPAGAAVIELDDADFPDEVWQSTTEIGGSGFVTTAGREESGGNPGAFRRVVQNSPGAPEHVVRHQHTTLAHDPATMGTVNAVSWRMDIRTPAAEVGDIVSHRTSFLLFRDGVVAGESGGTMPGGGFGDQWVTIQQECATAEDLSTVDLNAAPLGFGYRTLGRSFVGQDHVFDVDNLRVTLYTDESECEPTVAPVGVDKDAGDHEWGVDPVISYAITASNDGETDVTSLTVAEEVPARTTFLPDASTPGWVCSPATDAGGDCTFPLGTLAAGESRDLTFVVRVNDGTDPAFDVYNEAALTSFGAGPLGIATVGRSLALPKAPPASAAEPAGFSVGEHPCAGPSVVGCATNCVAFALLGPLVPNECLPEDASPHRCCLLRVMLALVCLEMSSTPVASAGATRPSFEGPLLYRFRDHVLAGTAGGQRATELYYRHTLDMTRAGLADPSVLTLGAAAVFAWEPHLRGLLAGDDPIITQAQVDALGAALDAMRAAASPVLARAIDRGRERLDVATFPGLTMTQAVARLDALACATAASFASVGCRLDDLLDVIEASTSGKLGKKLAKLAQRARDKAAAAEEAASDSPRKARKLLRRAAKVAGAIQRRANSRAGQRALDESVRALVTEPIPALQGDLRALCTTTACS